MKSSTLLALAAGAAVLYFVMRPRTALAAPGTRPSTTSATPGTTARSQVEAAAAGAAGNVIQSVGSTASDYLTSLFSERPAVTTTQSYDPALDMYNF